MRKMGENGFLFFLCQIERKMRKNVFIFLCLIVRELDRWVRKKTL